MKAQLARLNRVAWRLYGSVWRFFARNDPKTLRAKKAVDWEADHYEEIPVVVACLRWTAWSDRERLAAAVPAVSRRDLRLDLSRQKLAEKSQVSKTYSPSLANSSSHQRSGPL